MTPTKPKGYSDYNETFDDLNSLFITTKGLRVSQFLLNYYQSKGYQINFDNIMDSKEYKDPYFMKDEEFLKDFRKFYLK